MVNLQLIFIKMLQIWLTIILIGLTYIGFKYMKVIRLKSYYAKTTKSLGYKVYQYPLSFIGSGVHQEIVKNQNQKNDAHYHFKHELHKYDLAVSNIIFRTIMELYNPQLIKEFFLKSNEGYYIKYPYAFINSQKLIGTDNLLVSQGQQWKVKRKILSSVFNFNFIISQISKIQEIVNYQLCKLQEKEQQVGGQKVVKCRIIQTLNATFSSVILKCFFKGDSIEKIGNENVLSFTNRLNNRFNNINKVAIQVFIGAKLSKFIQTNYQKQMNKQVAMLRSVARQVIVKRIKQVKQQIKSGKTSQENQTHDIIEALLKNKQILIEEQTHEDTKQIKQENTYQQAKKQQQVQHISIQSIINQFMTFYLAGSQTTASFTLMMIYRLATHPQIQQKIREQIQREIKSQKLKFQELKNLKYLQKVQKQVLRMDSAVGTLIPRQALKDHYLGNLKIFKGTLLIIRQKVTHYKQSQHMSPLQFNPQRWNQQKSKNIYSFIPFSAGARVCIGLHLSLLQNKIFIIQLLRKFKKIQIPKRLDQLKMKITGMYGPEDIITTLIKN